MPLLRGILILSFSEKHFVLCFATINKYFYNIFIDYHDILQLLLQFLLCCDKLLISFFMQKHKSVFERRTVLKEV